MVLTLGFGPPSLTESDDAGMAIRRTQLTGLLAMRPPTSTAQAVLVMDMETGRPVLERNARTQFAPASITKMMTAVVVLEHADLGATVTVQPDDLEEGSTMGLRAGDVVTVEDLLWGLLLPSGNDAAETLARFVGGGSVQTFVGMMNDKAAALGLTGTHFANPHGLDDDGHYSTALDLATLGRYAMQKPLFARIVSTRDYTVTAGRRFELHNTNQLLYLTADVPGVNGIKTGFTDNAGDSLVASVEREGRKVIVVVLGSTNRTAAAAGLVRFAYSAFAWVPLTPAGVALGLPTPPPAALTMVPAWQERYVKYYVERLGSRLVSSSPQLSPAAVLHCYVGSQEVARQALYASGG